MASAGLIEELNCSICLEIYTEPVMLKCGHNFCQVCIRDTLDSQEGSGVYSCPECRLQFQDRPLLEKNRKLCNIVESFMSFHIVQDTVHSSQERPVHSKQESSVHGDSTKASSTEPTTSLENGKCSIHRKSLEYYCFDDAVCVCEDCCFSGRHGSHQVELLDGAFKIRQARIKSTLQVLTTNKAEAGKMAQNLRDHMKEAQEKVSAETERVVTLFGDIKRHLEHLEKRILGDISFQAEQVVLSVSGQIQQLDMKVAKLSQKILDLEMTLKVTDPLAFLQEPENPTLLEEHTVDSIRVFAKPKLDVGPVSETLHGGLEHIIAQAKEMFGLKEATESKNTQSTAELVESSSGLCKSTDPIPDSLKSCHIEKLETQSLQSSQRTLEKSNSTSAASASQEPFLFFRNPYSSSSWDQQGLLSKIPDVTLPSWDSWLKK